MINVGITGQSGFVGTHLYNALDDNKEYFKCIPFEDNFFEDEYKLRNFVRQCDVIVHLAAMMRNPVEGVVYNTNMRLVNQVIKACESENVAPSIMFASSIQEDNGSEYGRCKQDGRKLLMKWAVDHHTGFGGMIFPNLFGPLARPNSHSFIATFCYKLTHGEEPQVLVDNTVSLKYIDALLDEIIPMLTNVSLNRSIINNTIEPDYQLKVTEVLTILEKFKKSLIDNNSVKPIIKSKAEEDLLNTFVSYQNYIL